MKEIINVTDIIEYLYCPRKLWLRKVKKIKTPLTKPMVLGFLAHKITDYLNKNERALVSSINSKITEKEINLIYESLIRKISLEIFDKHINLIKSYKINDKEFLENFLKNNNEEVLLRTKAITKTISLGFLGIELWRNLSPKYLTEFKIVSEALGLRGRIDRIELSQAPVPYELKTRTDVFESDTIQLSAYTLLLEDYFMKKIPYGIIQTTSGKTEIHITDELKNKVLEIAEKIREILNQEPALQENFKKCKNCQLKDDCLEL